MFTPEEERVIGLAWLAQRRRCSKRCGAVQFPSLDSAAVRKLQARFNGENGAAGDAGIAPRTLDRARKDMGLRPHRHGRGGWYLAKDANACCVAIFGVDTREELDMTAPSSKGANVSYDASGPGGALPLDESVEINPW